MIGPLLVNFIIDGLESIPVDFYSTGLRNDIDQKSSKPINSEMNLCTEKNLLEKSVQFHIVRFADDIIVLSNDFRSLNKIFSSFVYFFSQRGLCLAKTKVFAFNHNARFTFLGFVFHWFSYPRISGITVQFKQAVGAFARGGLYVYPCRTNVQRFKKQIKNAFALNTNLSVFKVIRVLNPIIQNWGDYFGIGMPRMFSRLDHYVLKRALRFLKRKFRKVSLNSLVSTYLRKHDLSLQSSTGDTGSVTSSK